MPIPDPILAEAGAFAADLGREDDLGAVVRAHIRIENCLVSFIESYFPAAGNLARMNLDFDDYVSLSLALGVPDVWGSCLRAMGTLRNRFAHKLDTTLDIQAVNNLYKSLPADGKKQVHASLARIRANDSEGAGVPERYSDLPTKDQFKLVAMIIWTRVRAWELSREAMNGRQHDSSP